MILRAIRLAILVAGCGVVTLLCACDTEQEGAIEVIQYSGPEIKPTPTMIQWKVNIDQNRVVSLDEDTSAVGSPPQRDTGTWHILFLDVGEPLPEFISLTARSSTSTSILVSGRVSIQDWDLEGVLSGEITGRMRPGVGGLQPQPLVRFWVDLRQGQE